STGVLLPLLRRGVGQLGQGLCRGDPDASGDTGLLEHLRSHLSRQTVRGADSSQVGKSLVDAVHLQRWHHALDYGHHPLAHVAVEGIVTRERNDPMALKYVPDLVVWLSHF